MWIYAWIMLLTGAVTTVLSVLIYRGKTQLIHDYHQRKVTDPVRYGKAFGKALGVLATALLLSGLVSAFGEAFAWVAVAVLLVGMVIGLFCICAVQKKYNGGLF